jgi:hypothetical protein
VEQTKRHGGRQEREAMSGRPRRDCGLCSKQNIVRLDRHFKSVHSLKSGTMEWTNAMQSTVFD